MVEFRNFALPDYVSIFSLPHRELHGDGPSIAGRVRHSHSELVMSGNRAARAVAGIFRIHDWEVALPIKIQPRATRELTLQRWHVEGPEILVPELIVAEGLSRDMYRKERVRDDWPRTEVG